MHEAIEKLLILQDRDQSLAGWRAEITGLATERAEVNSRSANAEAAQAEAEQTSKELEVKKDALEVEIQAEQEKIRTYSKQQLETKDNTAYRALARQIEDCKKLISDLETSELMVMEEIDAHAEVLKKTGANLAEAKADQASAMGQIDERETNLNQNITDTESLRAEAAAGIEETTLTRYEKLLQRRGANIVVGITHGTCGGCHMKLPTSEIIAVKNENNITHCPNCSRILYYTRDMILEAD